MSVKKQKRARKEHEEKLREQMREWEEACTDRTCGDWQDYEDCALTNLEAMSFLEHVQHCEACSKRHTRLRRRRKMERVLANYQKQWRALNFQTPVVD